MSKITIKQHDITDCGVACLASISANYNLELPIARIRQFAGTDKKGTNVLGLIEAAEKLGFEAKGVRGDFDSLFKIPKPAIAHIIVKKKLQHYVVIYEVTKTHIKVMDPGTDASSYPEEPKDGVALDEEFSYEVNVHKGIIYLTFKSEGHETKTFTKSLLKSDFATKAQIPQQIIDVYASRRTVGVEREIAYAGEINYFKQGAYNQANGKATKSETYGGDIAKQYANGSYAEVWFKNATVGQSTAPKLD